ncbi:UNVERIFIED_CONTAM: hypothetical protein FKN15_013822 [Acipenser sinensis]
MKLKEIQRTANQAWSPASRHPTYLATGTSAQQLDASFSTSAALEIFELDFSDPSLDMKLRGSLSTTNRFHSLIWVNFGAVIAGSSGVLVGGGDNGAVTLYDPIQILASEKEAIVGQCEKHTGPVRTLDFNPFKSNLLASGANDSEIYIWDLNNFSNPMTPGAKSQPLEDVSVVAWNRQVQHILASAHPSGKAVVWDLRKNEPIIKISDHSNRMHCSGMLWHPEVATQLVLASEDDRLPVIQIWDLRFASSPLKILENHTRGILSISWSQADPELLLSSAKDNRILCWNPGTGEMHCSGMLWHPEVATQLVLASEDDRLPVIQIWDLRFASSPLKILENHTRGILSISWSQADPELLLSSAKDNRILCWNPGTGEVIYELPTSSQWCFDVQWCPRNPAILSAASFDGRISIYSVMGGSRDAQGQGHVDKVNFEDDARSKFLRLLGYSKEELEKKRSDESSATGDTSSSPTSSTQSDFFSNLPNDQPKFQISTTTNILGSRLEREGEERMCLRACLCYICSGNVEKLVECWVLKNETSSPLALEDLVEKVMVLRKSIEQLRGGDVATRSTVLAEKLTQYANLLAAQGRLAAAMSYLPASSSQLRDRLFHAQGEAVAGQQPPPFPYNSVQVGRGARPASTAVSTHQLGHRTQQQGSYEPAFRPQMQPSGPPPVFTPQPTTDSMPRSGMPAISHGPPAGIFSRPPYPQHPATASGSQEGWNDPPNVRGGTRKKKLHESYTPPAPITAPVMNLSMEHKALHPQASLPQETIQVPPGAPIEANIQTLHQLPAEKIEKKEIPQEHLVLKTTFDGLLKSCLLAAGDPQTKRKLDDASKRLEYLYDKLREQALTPNILGGLHEIGRCVEGRNYQQALAVHTQIVSSSNFSDISAFMPIVKVVITIANKLSI